MSFILTDENILALNLATFALLAKLGTFFKHHDDRDIFITKSADVETGVLVTIPLTPENCLRIANGELCKGTKTFNFKVSNLTMETFYIISQEYTQMPWNNPSKFWAKIQQKQN